MSALGGKRTLTGERAVGSAGRYRTAAQIRACYLRLSSGENIVDLNYLFHRQQVERSRAERADSGAARDVHEELAKHYEERIEKLTSDEHYFPKEAGLNHGFTGPSG